MLGAGLAGPELAVFQTAMVQTLVTVEEGWNMKFFPPLPMIKISMLAWCTCQKNVLLPPLRCCLTLLRGRTQIDSFTQNVQWTFGGGGGGKRTGRFQNCCFIEISSENFLQVTLLYSFSLLYIMVVRKNFDSSESILVRICLLLSKFSWKARR